jgi:pyruvate-ferredoxin/flavodoxin oxidoreductase
MLSSGNVQEAQDLAVVAHLSTLEARIPFLHFFDGFRTSHSIQKIVPIEYETLREMLDMKYVEEFRKLALKPEDPMCKVGAQNPDVYFPDLSGLVRQTEFG